MAPSLAALALAAPPGRFDSLKDWLLDKHSSYLDLLLVAMLMTLGLALSMRWRASSGSGHDSSTGPER